VVETITPQQFHDAGDLDEWRVVFAGASTRFPTDSFATGLALVEAIGRVASAVGHHADVDLRADAVTVTTQTGGFGELTSCDATLAQQIAAAARELGLHAEPAAVQTMQLTIDALVPADVIPFWAALLRYDAIGDEDLVDPRRRGPSIWFQKMDAPRPQRNRIHVDVSLPPDEAEARIAAAVAVGRRVLDDSHAPQWWTLADPEGNEADVATWLGRF
jgi:4a-hydroxytetrahydrobiopterin dehydratase